MSVYDLDLETDNSVQINFNYNYVKPEIVINKISKKEYFTDFPDGSKVFFPEDYSPSIELFGDAVQGYNMNSILKGIKKSKKEKIDFKVIYEIHDHCKIMKILSKNFKDLSLIVKNIYLSEATNPIYFTKPTNFNYFNFKVLYATENYKVTGSKSEIISELLLLRGFSSNLNTYVDSFVTTKFFGYKKWLYPKKQKNYPKMYFDFGLIKLIS